MGTFATAAKNTMLGALTVDRVQLHSGAPGAAGTDNVIATTLVAATFAAADGGERDLSTDVDYTGLTPLQTITYVSFWSYNGGDPVFHGSSAITGDQAANAAGAFTLTAAGTTLSLSDPA
jgi:hypothetical protein